MVLSVSLAPISELLEPFLCLAIYIYKYQTESGVFWRNRAKLKARTSPIAYFSGEDGCVIYEFVFVLYYLGVYTFD